MLGAGKHLNSLHCLGMSTDSTQFGQLAHFCFSDSETTQNNFSLGEEAKKLPPNDLIKSISIITHFRFGKKQNMENPLSTSNGLSQCRSCFFFEPAGHGSKVKAAAVYAMLDGWGPGFGPRNPTSM